MPRQCHPNCPLLRLLQQDHLPLSFADPMPALISGCKCTLIYKIVVAIRQEVSICDVTRHVRSTPTSYAFIYKLFNFTPSSDKSLSVKNPRPKLPLIYGPSALNATLESTSNIKKLTNKKKVFFIVCVLLAFLFLMTGCRSTFMP